MDDIQKNVEIQSTFVARKLWVQERHQEYRAWLAAAESEVSRILAHFQPLFIGKWQGGVDFSSMVRARPREMWIEGIDKKGAKQWSLKVHNNRPNGAICFDLEASEDLLQFTEQEETAKLTPAQVQNWILNWVALQAVDQL